MQNGQQIVSGLGANQASIFKNLLRGYHFGVCEDPEATAQALDVRRQVYRGSGYDVPVPDAYDARSWLLFARHLDSGQVVGSMRVTPRFAGPFEAEEYLVLPPALVTPTAVEITRFAIVTEHRHSRRFLPVVALGLYKLACLFMRQLGTTDVVICSRPERSFAYQWLAFTSSGLSCRYAKLGDTEHELLTCDVRNGMAKHRTHRFWDFVFQTDHAEVVLPGTVPTPGFPPRRDVARQPLRRIA